MARCCTHATVCRRCTLRPYQVQIGAHLDVTGELLHFQPGEHVLATILPVPTPPTHQSLADSVSFMQTSPSWPPSVQDASAATSNRPNFHFNTQAPEFCPGVPIVAAMPDHIADLWTFWQSAAFSWEGEERVIMTWFVDHRWHFPHNPRGRRLQLHSDYVNWDSQIRQSWIDYMDPNAVIELHLVMPQPPAQDPELTAHVIVIQQPRDEWITSLVTAFDPAQATGPPFGQMAITTHEHLRPENVIVAAGLDRTCLGVGSTHTHTWQMWISGHPLNLCRTKWTQHCDAPLHTRNSSCRGAGLATSDKASSHCP